MNNVAVLSLEVLVTGITAMIWIVLLIVRLLFPDAQIEAELLAIFNSISVGNFLVSSILIYNVGWVIHHIGELLFDPIFQTKYRRTLFDDKEFYRVRTKIFQKGSDGTKDDIKFDRHILRISRSNILNFTALSIVSLFYLNVNLQVFLIVSVTSLLIALISFSQWHSRYQGTFKKFRDIYNSIIEDESNVNKNLKSIKIADSFREENKLKIAESESKSVVKKRNKKKRPK
jgi:hypothetical protein